MGWPARYRPTHRLAVAGETWKRSATRRTGQLSSTTRRARRRRPSGVSGALAWVMKASGHRCECVNPHHAGGLHTTSPPFTTSQGSTARARRYSYDALKVLQRVRPASGGQCGKYLKESMPLLLDLLEASGELDDEPRYTPAVRDELVAMSAATNDRYLAPVRATEQLRGKSTTKTGPLAFAAPSRSARPAGEIEAEPGFFEVDTVAHCGPTLKGEFTRTVNMTDVLTGWTFTRSIRNNAEKHIISALDAAVGCVPFPVLGVDFVGGSEFINHSVVRWAGDLDIYSRPLTPLQEERPGHHRVEEQPPGAPLRLLLPLRHQRGARGPGPSLGAGQRQAQLPAPASPSDGTPIRPAGTSASTTLLVPHWTGCWTPAP